MKTNILLTLGVATLSVAFSACSASVSTGTNTGNANAAKPANTATVTNTNSTASNTNAAAPAGGEVVKIEEGGLQMTLPKGFVMKKDGGDVIVHTADEGVAVRFSVPADGDYEKAVDAAAKQLDEFIKDVKVEQKAKSDTVNGLEVTSSFGTGKDENGKQVGWEMTIIKTDKKPVFAIMYAEEASAEKHSADLDTFFKSIKKM